MWSFCCSFNLLLPQLSSFFPFSSCYFSPLLFPLFMCTSFCRVSNLVAWTAVRRWCSMRGMWVAAFVYVLVWMLMFNSSYQWGDGRCYQLHNGQGRSQVPVTDWLGWRLMKCWTFYLCTSIFALINACTHTYTIITNCLTGIMTAFIYKLKSGKIVVTEVNVCLSVLMFVLLKNCNNSKTRVQRNSCLQSASCFFGWLDM